MAGDITPLSDSFLTQDSEISQSNNLVVYIHSMFTHFKLIIIVLMASICCQVGASLNDLAREFLEKNSSVRSRQLQARLAYYDYQDISFQRELSLTASHIHNDNNLENFSGLSASLQGGVGRFPLISDSSTIGLSKEFMWGGTLSLDNSFQKTSLQGFAPAYGFVQALTYSQNLWRDFFGRNYKSTLRSGELGFREAELQGHEQIDNELTAFAEDFLNASLNKTLIYYQNQALVRSRKRLKIIKKRVRNGLSEKVDLIQARVSALNQEEALKSRENELNASLERLTSQIHRPLLLTEISDWRSGTFKISDLPQGDVEDSLALKRLKALIDRTKEDYERSSDLSAPSLTLSATLRNNDFDISRSESVSQGFLGKDNQELNIALNLSWAIGNRREKNEQARRLLQKEVASYQLTSAKKSLEQTHDALVKQIEALKKNIGFAKSRIKLTKKSLGEYEKLYKRGRADFDQILQAEEAMIDTQSDYTRYYANHERLVYALANVYGAIRKQIGI
jgi:outer membrane protein